MRPSIARLQVSSDNIIDEGKITALLAITKNSRLVALEHLPDELGNHGGIGRCGVLARAEDVEVPQTDCLKSEYIVKTLTVQFTRSFRNCVRRDRIEFHLLPLG